MTEQSLRSDIIKVCKRLYDKEFVTAQDGNVSARLSENRFLMTPSGFCKADLSENDLIICNLKGEKVSGKHSVTSEAPMHLEAYKQRPDVNAVVHAHPTVTTALSLAGVSLARCVLPEVILSLGSIPMAKYATPTTPEGAEVIKDLIKKHDAIVLDRHGSLTVGTDVWSAYFKLEKIEHTAKITLAARQVGSVRKLTSDQKQAVVSIAKSMGVRGLDQEVDCYGCGGCGKPETSTKNNSIFNNDQLINSIADAVVGQITKLSS